MWLRCVAALKLDDNTGRSRLFSRKAKLALREIKASHTVASLRQFDGMSACTARDIQDLFRPIGPKLPFHEVHFTDGSLGKALSVIRLAKIGEERLVPLRHARFSSIHHPGVNGGA